MSAQSKLSSLALGLIGILTTTFILFNFGAGIISFIWLAILGEWGIIVNGVILMMVSGFLISIALMPSLLFAAPAAIAIEKGHKLMAVVFGGLAILYTVMLITIWCIWIMWTFTDTATVHSYIPILIWSYCVALGPWQWLAQQDSHSGNDSSSFTTFVAQIAYLVAIVMALMSANVSTVAYTFLAIMITGTIFQIVGMHWDDIKKGVATKEVKEALEILEQAGKEFHGYGFKLVSDKIEKALLENPKALKKYVEDGNPLKEKVYMLIATTAGEHVGSGHYHIYRGLLDEVGNELLEIFDSTIDELVILGTLKKKEAKEHKETVRENIKEMG